MKRAFTLVELLVVVVVLVTLMTIVFRIGNIGDNSSRRAVTIDRMQRLENALSGYYAAFGMYPPVRLQGERNIYLKVGAMGLQNDQGEENEDIWGWVNTEGTAVKTGSEQKEAQAWAQVRAACLSQPVACEFPFSPGMKDVVAAASETLKMWAQQSEYMTADEKTKCAAGFDDGVTDNIGRHTKNMKKIEWSEIQLFHFGVMSYLLPRYLVMMNGDRIFFTSYSQWTGNNRPPSSPLTGKQMKWDDVYNRANSDDNSETMEVANIPSQAVCARWMANFEKSLACNYDRKLFGVQIRGDEAYTIPYWNEGNSAGESYMTGTIYSPNGWNGGTGGNYILDCITMKDGWDNDLYYYSPEPFQGYTIWSSGANGKTFPPWMAREKLSADANRCVSYWTHDDIMGLKN